MNAPRFGEALCLEDGRTSKSKKEQIITDADRFANAQGVVLLANLTG